MIARHYTVEAKADMADTLEQELFRLADVVRTVPGSVGFEVLRDLEQTNKFVFIEKWESVDAHKGALAHIPRETFAGFMAAVAGPLTGTYLNYLKTI